MNDLRIKGAKGFLLDLDGVFIQSGAILPGALETVEIFNSRNKILGGLRQKAK